MQGRGGKGASAEWMPDLGHKCLMRGGREGDEKKERENQRERERRYKDVLASKDVVGKIYMYIYINIERKRNLTYVTFY